MKYLSALPDFHKDMHIHVYEADKREDSSCEGWVPDKR